MIELLQSGRINNRLLCEFATHDNFQRLMADIEIYVDRIASMQISNLNAIVDMAWSEILSKYNPEIDDVANFRGSNQEKQISFFATNLLSITKT